ncbi:MAG: hypothetical protein WCX83_00055 [Candidatus Cloacimonas sp.]|jgi:hypothetical protein|nr:hypothetical protein [Candidatus Cloacimonadota bacterium]
MLSKLLGAGAKYYLNKKIKGIGEISELLLDTPKKQLSLTAYLKGEEEPLSLFVHSYEVYAVKGKNYLKINSFSSTKEWLDLAVKKWAVELKFSIPPIIAALLR